MGGNISSAQLAHRLGISPDAMRNYESGRTALPLQIIFKLHREGLSMHWLLDEAGGMFADNPEGKRLREELERAGIDYIGREYAAAAGDAGAVLRKQREKK